MWLMWRVDGVSVGCLLVDVDDDIVGARSALGSVLIGLCPFFYLHPFNLIN